MVRVAVNVEQLLHGAPGGIGRYTAELVRLLPGLGIDVTPFTARHSPAEVEAAFAAHGLTGLDPVILPLPAPVLYDALAPTLSPEDGGEGGGHASLLSPTRFLVAVRPPLLKIKQSSG